jgi:hypothetical protein
VNVRNVYRTWRDLGRLHALGAVASYVVERAIQRVLYGPTEMRGVLWGGRESARAGHYQLVPPRCVFRFTLPTISFPTISFPESRDFGGDLDEPMDEPPLLRYDDSVLPRRRAV